MKPRREMLWPALSGLLVLGLGLVLYDLGATALELGRFSGSLKWRLAGLAGWPSFSPAWPSSL